MSGWTKGTSGTPPRRRGGATKRATDALVQARTGEEPERTPETGAALRMLTSLDGNVRRAQLLQRYHVCHGHLHLEYSHSGLCDPREDTERRIRETSDYIEDAAPLARTEPALTKMRRSVVLPMSTPSRSLSNSLRWEWLAPWYLVRAR